MYVLLIIPIMFTIFMTQVNRGYTKCKTEKLNKKIERLEVKCEEKEATKQMEPTQIPKGCNGPSEEVNHFEFLSGKQPKI